MLILRSIIAQDAVKTFDQLPVQENMLNTPSPVLDVTSSISSIYEINRAKFKHVHSFAAMFQKTTKFTIFSQSITVFLSPSFSIFKKISS